MRERGFKKEERVCEKGEEDTLREKRE